VEAGAPQGTTRSVSRAATPPDDVGVLQGGFNDFADDEGAVDFKHAETRHWEKLMRIPPAAACESQTGASCWPEQAIRKKFRAKGPLSGERSHAFGPQATDASLLVMPSACALSLAVLF